MLHLIKYILYLDLARASSIALNLSTRGGCEK
jgi:hypothetical protein